MSDNNDQNTNQSTESSANVSKESKTKFTDLNLIEPIQKAIEEKGYEIPTPIQAKSIPIILENKDLMGIAKTGTGKTAAFTLPILQQMQNTGAEGISTLILAPTRELAAQIGESIESYGKYLNFKHAVLFGGVRHQAQIDALDAGANVIVATPGRLIDLLGLKKLSIKDVKYFVLDEADRMLDMGFAEEINQVLERLPQERQSLFFSATMSKEVTKLAKSLLKDPVKVEVDPESSTVDKIKQQLYFIDKKTKQKLLLKLLKKPRVKSALVFTRTKHKADHLVDFFTRYNVSARAIHKNKSQEERTQNIQDFKDQKFKVLVATDLAARGIDIDTITHVVNFELPADPKVYVHRIGRTGRAGSEGMAYTFCSAEERSFLENIEKLIKQEIQVINHKYHSDYAQNAVGENAVLPPGAAQKKNGKKFKGPKPKHKYNKKKLK